MKKLLCGILAAVMTLSLCACGEDRDDDRDERKSEKDKNQSWNEEQNEEIPDIQPADPVLPEEILEPSSEDLQTMTEYYYLVAELNSDTVDISTNEVRKHYYDRLQSLSAVDKWCGTEFASPVYLNITEDPAFDNSTDWDRQAVMQKFYIVEDVRINYTVTETDHLGNAFTTEGGFEEQYYPDGKIFRQHILDVEMASLDGPIMDTMNTEATWEYDENGRVVKITYRSYNDGPIMVIQNFIYNDQGQLIEQIFKSNTEERKKTYSYNELGQCVSVNWEADYGESVEICYTYDENNNVTTAEKIYYNADKEVQSKRIFNCTYDAAGKLICGYYEEQYWGGWPTTSISQCQIDQYTYQLDEFGRIVQISIVPGAKQTLSMDGTWTSDYPATFASVVYDIHYGDYYGILNEPAA